MIQSESYSSVQEKSKEIGKPPAKELQNQFLQKNRKISSVFDTQAGFPEGSVDVLATTALR